MSLPGWSTTAGSNATVGSIDWAEGMAPAQVNNSARAMMADMAAWYRQTPEWIDRGDTPVYVGASSFKFTGSDKTAIYSVGRRVRLIAPTPGTIYGLITASVYSTDTTLTISWDSTTLTNETLTSIAVGIIKNATTGQSLDAGNIKRIREWGMPAGSMVAFGSTTAPNGWLLCYGQTVSRTTYADLFTAISTKYGSTDSATFKVPDRRGRASFCLNNLGGSSGTAFVGLTTLGAQAGSKTTTATGSVSGTSGTSGATTLTASQIPALTYTLNSGDVGDVQTARFASASNSNPKTLVAATAIGTNATGGSHTHTGGTLSATFTGDAVTSAPPYIVDAWIIKI